MSEKPSSVPGGSEVLRAPARCRHLLRLPQKEGVLGRVRVRNGDVGPLRVNNGLALLLGR